MRDRPLPFRRVLLLQGPAGPFFRILAGQLQRQGATVWKVNFNAGDASFYPGRRTIAFRGRQQDWPDFFRRLIVERAIDAVALFGDSRLHHRQALDIAGAEGVPVFVFEEGYLRPDHVTVEIGGVNGTSSLMEGGALAAVAAGGERHDTEIPVGNAFPWIALHATLYSVAMDLGRPFFPHYRHRRPSSPIEFAIWMRAAWRKLRYCGGDRLVMKRLLRDRYPYFLVPLQVYNDSQISRHSPYRSVDAFIVTVLESFARSAPHDSRLVFKQHPLDRGHVDYSSLIAGTAAALGCGQRVLYIRDGHLPTLLPRARGVVTVNSTVGLSSLHHGTPVKTLGSAIYDKPGLTAQCSLADFWHDPGPVDAGTVAEFRRHLARTCQANGSFYTGWSRTGVVAAVADRMSAQYLAAAAERQLTQTGRTGAGPIASGAASRIPVPDDLELGRDAQSRLPAE